MKLQPLSDKVVVKMLKAEENTHNGIILTSTIKEDSQFAEVVEVGPGEIVDEKYRQMTVASGDKVIINKHSGIEVKLGTDNFVIVGITDILAIVK